MEKTISFYITLIMIVLPGIVNSQITSNLNSTKTIQPQTLFETGYDYFYKTASRKALEFFDLDGDGYPNTMGVWIKTLNETDPEKVYFFCKIFGLTLEFNAFDNTISGFSNGSVQVYDSANGNINAFVLAEHNSMSIHSLIDLNYLQPIQPFPDNYFGGGSPQFIFLQNGSIYAVTNDYKIYISTDVGENWSVQRTIGDGDVNIDFSIADGPEEVSIIKSDNDETIAVFGTWENAIVQNDTITALYLYYSADYGTTWNGKVIGRGSEFGQISNRNYAPSFKSHLNGVISDQGDIHIICNGVGRGFYQGGIDTVDVYPLLYWNSISEEWFAVSDEVLESPNDDFGNSISDYAPINSLGQSYPAIDVTPDGKNILTFWVGPEYTGVPGYRSLNIFPGDQSSNSRAVYYTDLYYVEINSDSIINWSYTHDLEFENQSETFPFLNLDLVQLRGNNLRSTLIPFQYFIDDIPGSYILGDNGFSSSGKIVSDEIWVIFDIWPINVEVNTFLSDYTLLQNYPNPFNPSTKIKFSIPQKENVILKVYNILGKEVAVLVNKEMEAGEYDIEFSSDGLNSGVYFYTLEAGNYRETKKMILMK